MSASVGNAIARAQYRYRSARQVSVWPTRDTILGAVIKGHGALQSAIQACPPGWSQAQINARLARGGGETGLPHWAARQDMRVGRPTQPYVVDQFPGPLPASQPPYPRANHTCEGPNARWPWIDENVAGVVPLQRTQIHAGFPLFRALVQHKAALVLQPGRR